MNDSETRQAALLDPARLAALRAREEETFASRTTRSRDLLARGRRSMPCGVPMAWMAGLYRHCPPFVVKGAGAYFEDVDGNRYLDMNQADLFAALGFTPQPVIDAVAARAADGNAFMLPTEDGLVAAELLAERVGLPFWQFTGAASASNAEAIRLARLATGRERIVMFAGKYHGHIDDVLVGEGEGGNRPELLGLAAGPSERATIVPFNDLGALAAALGAGDVACLLAEPMLTNCNIVFPDNGFWAEAQALIHAAGSLLIIDEAHCFSFAYGGLTRAWGLKPDMVVLGKGLGSGISFGAYGMTERLAGLMSDNLDVDVGLAGLAVGGTTFANGLALAAARAALEDCLTRRAYERVTRLGESLGGGLEEIFARKGLCWRAPRIGGRSGWVLGPELPRNAAEAARSLDAAFIDTRRVFMANRGIWEAIASAGPACSFAHEEADVARYLEVAEGFLDALSDPDHQV